MYSRYHDFCYTMRFQSSRGVCSSDFRSIKLRKQSDDVDSDEKLVAGTVGIQVSFRHDLNLLTNVCAYYGNNTTPLPIAVQVSSSDSDYYLQFYFIKRILHSSCACCMSTCLRWNLRENRDLVAQILQGETYASLPGPGVTGSRKIGSPRPALETISTSSRKVIDDRGRFIQTRWQPIFPETKYAYSALSWDCRHYWHTIRYWQTRQH